MKAGIIMKNLLKELWYGNLNPNEDIFEETPEEKKTQKEYWECTEQFETLLPKDLQTLYEKREDLATDLRVAIETNAFVNGFCLGTKLMIEVFENNKKRKA